MADIVKFPQSKVDYLDRDGANRLRDQIVSYWRRRGYLGIDVQVHEQNRQRRDFDGTLITTPVFVIRSNIGPKGFPPKLGQG